jgi:hypothetical protein
MRQEAEARDKQPEARVKSQEPRAKITHPHKKEREKYRGKALQSE